MPSATVIPTGSPGGTSCAPAAGVTVSLAGCAVGGGGAVGPPPDVPLADTVGSLLHAPSVITAASPSATAAAARRVEFFTVTLIPLSPFATPHRDVPWYLDVDRTSSDERHNVPGCTHAGGMCDSEPYRVITGSGCRARLSGGSDRARWEPYDVPVTLVRTADFRPDHGVQIWPDPGSLL